MTGQRKEKCTSAEQAGLAMIKKEIEEQLQGSPCVALLCGSDPLLTVGSRTSSQQVQGTAPVGLSGPWNRGTSRLQGQGATRAILPPAPSWGIPTPALCFSAPAEERSCSWLKPWVFLVSVLAIKTAFVAICLGECQGLLTHPG